MGISPNMDEFLRQCRKESILKSMKEEPWRWKGIEVDADRGVIVVSKKDKTLNKEKVMTSKEKIIELMWWKNRIFKDAFKKERKRDPKYFTVEDENEILKWRSSTCDRVWEKVKNTLLKYIKNGAGKDVTATGICPFCIRFNDSYIINCKRCTYKSQHGRCESKNNLDTWSKIITLTDSSGNNYYLYESKILRDSDRKSFLNKEDCINFLRSVGVEPYIIVRK